MTHGAHWLYRAAVRQILPEGGPTHYRRDGCGDATARPHSIIHCKKRLELENSIRNTLA